MAVIRCAALAVAVLCCLPLMAQPATVALGDWQYTGTEGTPVMVTFHRSGDMTQAFTIEVTPNTGWTILFLQGNSVHFAPGQGTRSLPIGIADDEQYVGTRTVYFDARITSPNARFMNLQDSTFFYIEFRDDEEEPGAEISDAAVVEGQNGTVEATFTVTLPVPATGASQTGFEIFTADISATAGVDYTPLKQTVYFAAGEQQKTLTVSIHGDMDGEHDETFRISARPIQFLSWYGLRREGTVTIVNDDARLVAPTETERGNDVTITLELPPAFPGATATITTDPNILAAPASLDIPAGALIATFTVKAVGTGVSALTVTLPNQNVSTNISVIEPLDPIFEPASITVVHGESARVKLSTFPSHPEAVIVSLRSTGGGVQAPPTALIPANGSTEITVRGLHVGRQTLTATLGAQFGSRTGTLVVNVTAAPPRPSMFGVSPATGASAGTTEVTIRGERLEPTCAFRFDNVLASRVTFVSATSITVIAPPHVAGVVDVTMTCGIHEQTLARAFTYVDVAPMLASVAPSFGSTAGGTWTRISGTNLLDSCGVLFDGVASRHVTMENGALLAVAPPHAAGRVSVGVRCESGTAALTDGFTYSDDAEPAPSISSVDRLDAAPGETIVISGAHFRPGDVVTIGNMAATILRSAPDVHVVRVPELAPGTYAINVNTTTTGPIFTVAPAVLPEVRNAVFSGNELHLEGRGFRPTLSFTLGNHKLEIVTLSFTHAVLRLPWTLPDGEHALALNGTAASNVSVSPRLTIASASPACAAYHEQATVTLRGSGFESGARVAFGNVFAPLVTFVDATTLRLTAPRGAIGANTITVTNPSGAAATLTNGFRFFSPEHPDSGCAPSRTRAVRH